MGDSRRPMFDKQHDNTWVETSGVVVRLLHDDREGSRHQRFILDVGQGQTLLIAHNIDLANRVPLALGDRVAVRGVYEWSDPGGLIHWTHHDPHGVESGGHILFRRKIYQ